MKRLLTVIALIATMSSCKKSSNTTLLNTSFSPVTVGSTWTYLRNSSDSAFKDSVYKFTATDSTIAVGDTIYSVVNTSAGGDIYYAAIDTGYFRRGSLLSSLGIPELSTFSEYYLPKILIKNATWSNHLIITYQGIKLPVTLAYTLQGAADGLSVLGNNFSNVAHVSATFTTIIYGTPIQLGTGDFYYAEGIGLISFNLTTIDPITHVTATTTFKLKSYTIK